MNRMPAGTSKKPHWRAATARPVNAATKFGARGEALGLAADDQIITFPAAGSQNVNFRVQLDGELLAHGGNDFLG